MQQKIEGRSFPALSLNKTECFTGTKEGKAEMIS